MRFTFSLSTSTFNMVLIQATFKSLTNRLCERELNSSRALMANRLCERDLSSSRALIKLRVEGSNYPEGNFGGNQLLDGSISLSPLYPRLTIDLHIRTAAGFRSVHPASPVLLTKNGPLGAPSFVARLRSSKPGVPIFFFL